MALTLEDADLSGGFLGPDISEQNGRYLAAETGRAYDTKSQAFFLDKICHRRLYSISGQQMIQPFMNETLKAFGLGYNDAPQVRHLH
jgi:hypothetical protein